MDLTCICTYNIHPSRVSPARAAELRLRQKTAKKPARAADMLMTHRLYRDVRTPAYIIYIYIYIHIHTHTYTHKYTYTYTNTYK